MRIPLLFLMAVGCGGGAHDGTASPAVLVTPSPTFFPTHDQAEVEPSARLLVVDRNTICTWLHGKLDCCGTSEVFAGLSLEGVSWAWGSHSGLCWIRDGEHACLDRHGALARFDVLPDRRSLMLDGRSVFSQHADGSVRRFRGDRQERVFDRADEIAVAVSYLFARIDGHVWCVSDGDEWETCNEGPGRVMAHGRRDLVVRRGSPRLRNSRDRWGLLLGRGFELRVRTRPRSARCFLE